MTRGPDRPTGTVPPVLPLLQVQVVEGDELLISENGQQASDVPIRRRQLGGAIARFAERAGGPIRVEVYDADGTSYADILAPRPGPAGPMPSTAESESTIELMAPGFVPGEDVAIALIIRETSARPDGIARALIGRNELPTIASDVVFLGRTSGTFTIVPSQRKVARTCPSDRA